MPNNLLDAMKHIRERLGPLASVSIQWTDGDVIRVLLKSGDMAVSRFIDVRVASQFRSDFLLEEMLYACEILAESQKLPWGKP